MRGITEVDIDLGIGSITVESLVPQYLCKQKQTRNRKGLRPEPWGMPHVGK